MINDVASGFRPLFDVPTARKGRATNSPLE